MKIYFWLLGGLGDIIWGYLRGPQWSKLSACRRTFPDARIKAIVVSHNPQALEIIRFNPLLDEIEQHPPKREMRDLKWTHIQIVDQYSNEFVISEDIIDPNWPDEHQILYLSNREKEFVEAIPKPYVFIHPFASTDRRTVFKSEEYIPYIEKCLAKGINVVVCGDTYIKSFGDKEQFLRYESLNYEKKGLYNLIGKTNARVATQLALNASDFVGMWSCFSIARWSTGKKATVLVIPDNLINCNRLHDGKYKEHHKEDRILDRIDLL